MPNLRLNCWFLDCSAGFQFALPRLDRREAAGAGDGKLLVLAPRSRIWLDLRLNLTGSRESSSSRASRCG